MIVRSMGPENADALYKLGLKEWKGEEWYSRRYVENILKADVCDFRFGCFIQTGPEPATLIGALIARLIEDARGWICLMIVDKKHRRMGIGSNLMGAMFAKHQKLEHPNRIFVDVLYNDHQAEQFYIANGFKLMAEVNHWFGEDQMARLFASTGWVKPPSKKSK